MSDILKRIKDQIAEQTRAPLNTDLHKTKTITTLRDDGSFGSDSGGSDIVSPLIPQFTTISYTLNRGQIAQTWYTMYPEDILDYSGSKSYEVVNQSGVTGQLGGYGNIIIGAQVRVLEPSNLRIKLLRPKDCFMSIWVKKEGSVSASPSTNYIRVYSEIQENAGKALDISVPVDSHYWHTILIIYYNTQSTTSDPYGIRVTTQGSKIYGWRGLDNESPTTPSNLTTSFEIIREATAVSRVKLSWDRNTDTDFGGNGIYRQSAENSGVVSQNKFPATILQAAYDRRFSTTEKLQYFYTYSNSPTLSIGQLISFTNSTNPTVQLVHKIPIGKNRVVKPYFSNTTSKWVINAPATISTDHNAIIGDQYVKISYAAANNRYKVIGTTFVSITGSLYKFGFVHSHDLAINRKFNRGGYGSTPSRWSYAGLTSVTATRLNGTPVAAITHTTATGSLYSDNQTTYVSASATYSLYAGGTFNGAAAYKISLKLASTGAAVYTTPTITGSSNLVNGGVYFRFKPSTSGTVFISYNFDNSASWTAAKLINPIIEQTVSKTLLNEFVEVSFFDSGYTPCSRPTGTVSIDNSSSRLTTSFYAAGTTAQSPDFSLAFPTGCAYVKLAYVASINSAVNKIPLYRNLYVAFGAAHDQPSYSGPKELMAFATLFNIWRVSATPHTLTTNETIYTHRYEHVVDRPRQNEDGAKSIYYDYSIDDNTTYRYMIDAYDTSQLKNRSLKLVGSPVTTGDTTAPKTPSGYLITGKAGVLSHLWTNPTASDLKYIQISKTSDFTNVVYQGAAIAGGPPYTGRFTEAMATVDIGVVQTRYIRAIDSWGNTSGWASDTATPKPYDTTDSGVTISWLYAGNPVSPNENGWYNIPVTASVLYEGSAAVASYFYSSGTIGSSSYASWIEIPTGQKTFTGPYQRVVRFKIKDTYGNESPPTEGVLLQINQVTPSLRRGSLTEIDTGPDWKRYVMSDGYSNRLTLRTDTFGTTTSGLWQVAVERAVVGPTTCVNPGFDITTPKDIYNKPIGWSSDAGVIPLRISLVSGNAGYYGNTYCKVETEFGFALGTVRSTPVRVVNGDSVIAFSRICFASIGSAMSCKWKLINYGTSAVLASLSYNRSVATATWESSQLNYTAIGNATLQLTLYADFQANGAKSHLLLDETILTVNPAFATIAKLTVETKEWTDRNTDVWNRYLYRYKIVDKSGNYSEYSSLKYAQVKPKVRNWSKNILANSSFEDTHYVNGTIMPLHWGSQAPLGKGSYSQYSSLTNVAIATNPQNVYNGNIGMLVAGKGAGVNTTGFLAQNAISILPYNGVSRRYILSAYVKNGSQTPSNLNGVMGIYLYNDAQTTIGNKTFTLNSSSVTTGYSRVSIATLSSAASLSNISVAFIVVTGTLLVDAVQLEESFDGSIQPSQYNDNLVITSDYLQSSFIRGYMIRADQIYAEHLQADSITSAKITASAVTVDKLSLTESRMMAPSRLPMEIKLYPNLGSLGGYNFVAGTKSDTYPSNVYFYAGIQQDYSNPSVSNGEMYIVTGASPVYFDDQGSTSKYYSTSKTGLGTVYNREVPTLIRPINAVTNNNSVLIVHGLNGVSATVSTYICYATIGATSSSVGRKLYGSTNPTCWSTPSLLHNNIGHFNGITTKGCRVTGSIFLKIDHVTIGSLELSSPGSGPRVNSTSTLYMHTFLSSCTARTRVNTISLGVNTRNCDFDIASNGTMLWFALSVNSTIYLTGRNRSNYSVAHATIQIPTYDNLDNTYTVYTNKDSVRNVNICRATLDTYVMTYQLSYSPVIYYKILDLSNPSVVDYVVGKGEDTPLFSKDLPDYPAYYFRNRLSKGFGTSVIAYQSGDISMRSGTKKPTGGSVVPFRRIAPTISMETLFVRPA